MENFDFVIEEYDFNLVDPGKTTPEQEENPDIFIEGVTIIEEAPDHCIVKDGEVEKAQHMIATFGVNKSSDVRNVRSGVGTSSPVVAKMTVKESFVFTGLKSTLSGKDWWQILILNSSGSYVRGWYQGANGVSFWHNNGFGVSTISHNGFSMYCDKMKVNEATNVYTTRGGLHKKDYGDLKKGDYIYTCRKGGGYAPSYGNNPYEDFVEIFAYSRNGSMYYASSDTLVYPSGSKGYFNLYVDTQLKHGATHVKGNW